MSDRITTKRLQILPRTDAELRAKGEAEADAHMKAAYGEMFSGALRDPKNRLWYTDWRVMRRADKAEVGSLGFKGPPKDGRVEIGYGVETGFRRQGYAEEAVRAAVEWAFGQEGVYAVEAETDPENAASQALLAKLGFLPAGSGAEGPRFRLLRPKSAYLSIFPCLGVGCGLCFGAALGSLALGMAFGMAVGLAVGAALDAGEKKKRAALGLSAPEEDGGQKG